MIFQAFTFVRGHWKLFGLGLLLLALVFTWNSRNSWKQEAADWKDATAAWRAAFETQKQAYIAAQEAARVKAEAQKIKEQRIYEDSARTTLAMEQEAARLRAAAAAYARANRMRNPRTGAVAGDAGGTGGAGTSGAAAGSDGAGEDAVVLDRSDFETLVDNSIRLSAVNKWGERLLAEGLAVKTEGE